ncbi:MAG: hypothetical protein ACREO3_07870, partial [Arenimonas sp.]
MSTEIEDLKAKFRPAAQIAALAFFVLWICLVVYPWISPAGRQARTRLERIKPGQVAEISIIPAGNHPA